MKIKTRAPGAAAQPVPGGGAAGARPRLALKLGLALAALALSALLAEAVLQAGFKDRLFVPQDERNLLYRFDPVLGWFPIPNSVDHFLGSRPITVINNSEGFRAPEHRPNSKPGVLFLGDSFVWGFDVEAAERFTDKLQARHPEWSVYNLGVSGYGTDQEYLLLQQRFDSYHPQVVFLVFCCETDDDDNSSNSEWGYYKPYCTVEGNRLQVHGLPVPRSERAFLAQHPVLARSCLVRLLTRAWFRVAAAPVLHNPNPTGPIIRDLQKFVQSKGAVLVVGLTRANPPLEDFLSYFKIPFVDLSTPLRYPHLGGHWTPEGHTFVCDKIEQFLQEGKYLQPGPATAEAAAPH